MEPNRTGKTVVPGAVITGQTVVPGQGPQGPVQPPSHGGPGLDKMLEIVSNAPDPGAQAFLLVISGAEPGRLHVLDRPELVIGRSKYANIRVNERAISQQHAKIVRVGDRYRIFDLGSTNGTFVNDQRVDQADLKVGDVVRTGETVFTYMTSSSGEPSHGDATMALPASAGPRGQAGPASSPHPLARRQPHAPMRPATPPMAQVIEAPPLQGEEGADLIALLMRVMAFLSRYWLSILLLTAGGIAAGVVSYKFFKPPATAEFAINLVQDPADNPYANGKRMNLEFFRTAKASFLRPGLIAQTLQQLGETDITPGRIREVQQRLQMGPERGSQTTYQGSYAAPTPEEAIDFLKVHLKLFLEHEIDRALKQLLVEVETLRQELDNAEKELDAQEQAILAFKQEHAEGLPEYAQELQQRYIELGTEKFRAASEVARTSAEIAAGRQRLKSEAPLIESRMQQARPYEDAIAEVKKKLATAKSEGKGASHPVVIELKQQLASLEGLRDDVLAKGTTNIEVAKNPVYEGARMSLADAEVGYKVAVSQLAQVTHDHKQAEAIVAELPRLQAEYAALTRDLEATKKIRENLFQKLTESQVQLQMERASTSARYDLITPPNVKPISPVREMIKRGFVLGALGFVLGILLGLFRDLRRMISARMAQLRQ